MPIGMGLATLISGVAGAGAGIFGASKQAGAAKEASQTEAQSAREALDWAKQVYGERQQQIAPYLQFGTSALGGLAALSGMPQPTQAAPSAPTGPTPPPGSGVPPGSVEMVGTDGTRGWVPPEDVQSALRRGATLTPGQTVPGSTSATGPAGPNPAAGGAGSAPPLAPAAASATVRMQAPDGSQQAVPSHLETYYTAKGARRV